MEWYVTNRDLIQDLAFNTGTSQNPAFTIACTSSEINLGLDFQQEDFYVFCDAIRRQLITGVAVSLTGTMKIDMNNSANITLLSKIHSLLVNGEIAQFNDLIQFKLLSSVSTSTLVYTKYQVPAIIKISNLGGSAEGIAEFEYELNTQGKATQITSS